MNRYTVAVLVANRFGVLNRVTSMFRRRQFNINSLSVSETESTESSRITITFEGGEIQKQQLVNQLYKLPDVISIKELIEKTSVSCELMLIKMKNEAESRDEIITAANAFGADTMDYGREALVFRLTADTNKIDEFINLMRDFTILEICRTGSVSLEKGSETIRKVTNF